MPHTCDQATAIHKSTNPTVTTTINAEWRQIKSNNNNKAKYSYVCSIAFWIACSTIIIIVDWIASTGYPSGGTHCVCVCRIVAYVTHTHTRNDQPTIRRWQPIEILLISISDTPWIKLLRQRFQRAISSHWQFPDHNKKTKTKRNQQKSCIQMKFKWDG